METATLPRTAPLAFWRIAEAFLHTLYALFGAPEDVAREHTLTRAAHTLMLSWLRVGEALLRRLLLIEAAAFPAYAPPPFRRHAGKTPAARERRVMSFTPENPEDWRVSFRCFPATRVSSPACGGSVIGEANDEGGANAPRSHTSQFQSAWPLAERYEALLRVFNAPHPYARRLARRLHAQPQCLAAVLHEPEDYIHRIDQAEAITQAARHPWRPLDSS